MSGLQVQILSGHKASVRCALFLPSNQILTASWDRTARIWDTISGAEMVRVTLDAAVTAVAVRKGSIALGDRLGRVHVLTLARFESADLRIYPRRGSNGKRLARDRSVSPAGVG